MTKDGKAVPVPVHGTKDVGAGRALETSWPVAKKLEAPKHWPTLRALDRAAAALGKRLVLVME